MSFSVPIYHSTKNSFRYGMFIDFSLEIPCRLCYTIQKGTKVLKWKGKAGAAEKRGVVNGGKLEGI